MTFDTDTYTTAVKVLELALEHMLDACGDPEEVQPGVYAGANLAEALSEALTALATKRGGKEALVAGRPGCWEAEHIRALVMIFDD